jgi:selenocysteine lyase/cysteine desulfurase
MSAPFTPAQLADLRALFPYTTQRVYLDTAAAGLTWAGHGAAVARFYDEVKNRGIDARPEWLAVTQRVRAQLAALWGVTAADITFVSNTTEALNLAAASLSLPAGSRVLMAADEFPSVRQAWALAERLGVQVVPVPVPDERERQAALLAALDDSTAVLAVSQTHWSTGTTLDLAALGAACRQHGALLVVDGIQALGAVPVALQGVDVFASSFFKWMLSGFGIGVLVTSAAGRARMQPAYRGYANDGGPNPLQYAHVNMPALYGLDATLDLFDRIGWAAIHARVAALGATLEAALLRHGLDPITPRGPQAGIRVVRVPDADAACARLAAQGISVSARGQGVRISPHFYNTESDVEQGALALAQSLARQP